MYGIRLYIISTEMCMSTISLSLLKENRPILQVAFCTSVSISLCSGFAFFSILCKCLLNFYIFSGCISEKKDAQKDKRGSLNPVYTVECKDQVFNWYKSAAFHYVSEVLLVDIN